MLPAVLLCSALAFLSPQPLRSRHLAVHGTRASTPFLLDAQPRHPAAAADATADVSAAAAAAAAADAADAADAAHATADAAADASSNKRPVLDDDDCDVGDQAACEVVDAKAKQIS